VAGFHAKRKSLKCGERPQVVPLRPETNDEGPIRRCEKSRETVRDLNRFIDYLYAERGVSPGTVKKYVYGVKRLKEWARSKRKSLSDLTTSDCRRWLISVAREAYSASTINGMHAAANSFFYFLRSEGDLITDPFNDIPYLRLAESLPRVLSHEEVALLMATPDTSTYAGLLDRTVMELLYASGMRVAELINQRLDRVDLRNCLILCTGKRSKQRVVLFGRDAKKWLEKYLVARSRIPRAGKSSSLFLKIDGKPLYGTLIWRHIKGVMTR
jgi:integrase/recombinase XerD